MEFDYMEAFGRNFGLFREGELDSIRAARVGVAGLGGCGSNHLLALVRMGFEKFNLADPDIFDQSNFNRQAGASCSTVGQKKIDVMAAMARDINPNCEITLFPDGITPQNVEVFVSSSDVGINAIDWFQIGLYAMFHDTYRRQGKYSTVGATPFSFGCAITVVGPETPAFNEIFEIEPSDGKRTQLTKFSAVMASAGYAARYLDPHVNQIAEPIEATHIASTAAALHLCTGVTAAEIFAIATGRRTPTLAPAILQFDMLERSFSVS